MIDKDILKGKWKEMKGELKRQWGDLTDDDLTRVEGDRDKLVGLLQQKYGYSKEKAEEGVNRFISRYQRGEEEIPRRKAV